MSRRIEKPRIILLDCPLEYKKGESQTALEIMKENDFSRVLEQVHWDIILQLKIFRRRKQLNANART